MSTRTLKMVLCAKSILIRLNHSNTTICAASIPLSLDIGIFENMIWLLLSSKRNVNVGNCHESLTNICHLFLSLRMMELNEEKEDEKEEVDMDCPRT